MRKGKLLLALSAVKRALAIGGASDPIAHSLVVRFALLAQAQDDSQSVRHKARRSSRLPFPCMSWIPARTFAESCDLHIMPSCAPDINCMKLPI